MGKTVSVAEKPSLPADRPATYNELEVYFFQTGISSNTYFADRLKEIVEAGRNLVGAAVVCNAPPSIVTDLQRLTEAIQTVEKKLPSRLNQS